MTVPTKRAVAFLSATAGVLLLTGCPANPLVILFWMAVALPGFLWGWKVIAAEVFALASAVFYLYYAGQGGEWWLPAGLLAVLVLPSIVISSIALVIRFFLEDL